MSFYQPLNPTTETVERTFGLHTTAQVHAIVDLREHVQKTYRKKRDFANALTERNRAASQRHSSNQNRKNRITDSSSESGVFRTLYPCGLLFFRRGIRQSKIA